MHINIGMPIIRMLCMLQQRFSTFVCVGDPRCLTDFSCDLFENNILSVAGNVPPPRYFFNHRDIKRKTKIVSREIRNVDDYNIKENGCVISSLQHIKYYRLPR